MSKVSKICVLVAIAALFCLAIACDSVNVEDEMEVESTTSEMRLGGEGLETPNGKPAVIHDNPGKCKSLLKTQGVECGYSRAGKGRSYFYCGECDNEGVCDSENHCQPARCGDGILQPIFHGEECDDGNTVNNDECTNACTLPVCGDAIVNNDEECDDGDDVNDNECTNACTLPVCGDAIVNNDEECDDGDDVNDNECTNECAEAKCGDGIVQSILDEECDDGNLDDSDACTSFCMIAECGDGILSLDEECDDGNVGTTDGCINCLDATCGDGYVEAGVEECDDANEITTDGCIACVDATCGDGYVEAGIEECDLGEENGGSGCTAECTVPPIREKLMLCGNSWRDISVIIPPWVNLAFVNSCTPDSDTQAMLISRSGNYDGNVVKNYIQNGGIVLTEWSRSDDVFSAVFTPVSQGQWFGSCWDTAPTVVQFNHADEFWTKIPFQPIPLSQSGCGYNISHFPGITPIAGWGPGAVSIAYRDLGSGRLWLTEFDWQDNEQVGDFTYSAELMSYIILTK